MTDTTSKPTETKDDTSKGSAAKLGVDETTAVNAMPTPATAVDSAGTERIIVVSPDSGWKPAPVEPDKSEVARLKKVLAAIELKNKERQKTLGLKS